MPISSAELATMAAEQGPRWRSRKEAWIDGYREGEQHAWMTGAAAGSAAEQQRDRLLEALQPFLVDLGVGCGYETLENIRETAEQIESEVGK